MTPPGEVSRVIEAQREAGTSVDPVQRGVVWSSLRREIARGGLLVNRIRPGRQCFQE